jgi:hypothetical protein
MFLCFRKTFGRTIFQEKIADQRKGPFSDKPMPLFVFNSGQSKDFRYSV